MRLYAAMGLSDHRGINPLLHVITVRIQGGTYLRGVLIVMLKDRVEKPIIDELLAAFHFPEDVRAEQLDVETILALSEAVKDLA